MAAMASGRYVATDNEHFSTGAARGCLPKTAADSDLLPVNTNRQSAPDQLFVGPLDGDCGESPRGSAPDW